MQARERPMALVGLSDANIASLASSGASESLWTWFDALEDSLQRLAWADRDEASAALASAVDAANAVEVSSLPHAMAVGGGVAVGAAIERQRFLLRRAARQHGAIDASLLARALLSASAVTDLRSSSS